MKYECFQLSSEFSAADFYVLCFMPVKNCVSQSIKTNLHSAMRRKRIRGVKMHQDLSFLIFSIKFVFCLYSYRLHCFYTVQRIKITRTRYAWPPRQCNTRQAPWAETILTKSCVVEGFLSPFSEAKFQHHRYRNVGLSSSKSQKFEFFGGKNLPTRDEPP